MFHACLQILLVFGRELVLIQPRHGSVDLLHSAAEIVHERAAFAGEIVNAGLACTIDIGIRRQISFWQPGRYRYIYEPIAKQTGTSHREFGSFRDLNVIISLQRYNHATTFANQPRTACDLSKSLPV